MTDRRRGPWLLGSALAALAAVLVFALADRYREGKWLLDDAPLAGVTLTTEPMQPRWLWERIEGEWSRPLEPVTVADGSVQWYLRKRKPIDGDLLGRLGAIPELSLDGRYMTDADLVPLFAAQSPRLVGLHLRHNDITDDSLTAAARLPGLKLLCISGSPVTRAGIDRLRAARPDLKIIADPFTRVGLGTLHRRLRIEEKRASGRRRVGYLIYYGPNDLAAAEAARLADVPYPLDVVVQPDYSLRVTGNHQRIEPDVFRAIATLPNLRSLDFDVRFVASEFDALRNASALESLDVQNTDVGDESIETIASIRSLKVVHLFGSRVTAEGERRLRELRPDLDIPYSGLLRLPVREGIEW